MEDMFFGLNSANLNKCVNELQTITVMVSSIFVGDNHLATMKLNTFFCNVP